MTEQLAACPHCGPGYRYGDEGCRHTPTQLAATREALRGVIQDAQYARWRENETPTLDDFVDAILSSGILRDADEVRCGAITDANGAYWEGNADGKNEGRAELQAAIEAALPEPEDHCCPGVTDVVEKLRALLAESTREGGVTELGSSSVSDGAAALREHDRRILAEQGKRLAKEYRRRADQTDEMRAATSEGNPMRGVWHGEASAYRYAADYAEYRDTAGDLAPDGDPIGYDVMVLDDQT